MASEDGDDGDDEYGDDYEEDAFENEDPLHAAVRDKSIDEMRRLLTSGVVSVTAKDLAGESALHLACYDGYADGTRLLLEHGAVLLPNSDGASPFHVAASSQFAPLEVLELLLKHGADPEAQDQRGRTAAHMAAEGGRIDVLECLSEISIDLLAKLDSDGCLPLHVAAQSPSPKAAAAVAWLLDPTRCKKLSEQLATPVSIDLPDHLGRSALSHAASASAGGAKCVSLLLQAGAASSLQDATGLTPLAHAVQAGASQSVCLLAAEEAGLYLRDADGHTVLTRIIALSAGPGGEAAQQSVLEALLRGCGPEAARKLCSIGASSALFAQFARAPE